MIVGYVICDPEANADEFADPFAVMENVGVGDIAVAVKLI